MKKLILLVLAVSALHANSYESSRASWEVVYVWLRGQTDQLAEDLETAHQVLLKRAEAKAPKLADRLKEAPPDAQRSGWGVLPELLDNGPFKSIQPSERKYDLGGISLSFVRSFRDGHVLAQHTVARADAPLEEAVNTYERLRDDMKNLEKQLAYHKWWQQAVIDQSAFFDGRNKIVARVREHQDDSNATTISVEDLSELAPFTAADDLTIETLDGGVLVLPVTVHTDVTDQAFLDAIRLAVQTDWNESQAALDRRFSIRIGFVVHQSEDLYPDGAPALEEEIDLDEHVSRFPKSALIMTTGAASTHAWKASRLLLGPNPITRRTLAHEFGHLLGFSDAYLRGYDGTIGDPSGVVFVEWTGLVDDLMGNPSGGRVTAALISQLIDAYSEL